MARRAICAIVVVLLSACSSGGSSSQTSADGALDDAEDDSGVDDDAFPPCTSAVSKGPWVVAVDETHAKVRWESCVAGASGITYAPGGGAKPLTHAASTVHTTVITDEIPTPFAEVGGDFPGTFYDHEVALDGLAAASCYTYALDADATAIGRFCTARASGDPFTFHAIGDTNPGLGVTPPMISAGWGGAEKPDFTLHGGDLQYYSSGLEPYSVWFGLMAPIFRAGAFFPAVGNHEDERTNEKVDYYDRFFGGAGFDGTIDYYRFHWGGVWFFSLDTEEELLPATTQGDWLEQELLDAQTQPGFRFSVVYFHRPFLTCGDTSDDATARAAWEPKFVAAGVKLVLQAHMHGYERFEAPGLTYVTAAGGGGTLGDVDQNVATRDYCATLRKASGAFFHYVKLDVKAGAMVGTVIDDKGAVRDTFTETVP